VIVILLLFLSTALLVEAMDAVGPVPSLGMGPSLKKGGSASFQGACQIEGFFPQVTGEPQPELQIIGVTETAYIRAVIFGTYSNGGWSTPYSEPIQYRGERLQIPVREYGDAADVDFTVKPLMSQTGYVPVALNTRQVDMETPLEYYEDTQTFRAPALLDEEYSVTYTRFDHDEVTLRNTPTGEYREYLQIPEDLVDSFRGIARGITRDLDNDFDRVIALTEFIKANYNYTLNFPKAPAGYDPVLYCLLESKQGVCTQFNSALILLARSIGIPARLVGGYLINSETPAQYVYPIMRHAYAEMPFEDLGWITFDATPSVGGSTCESIEEGDQPDVAEEPDVEPQDEVQDETKGEDPVDTGIKLSPECKACSGNVSLFMLYGEVGTAYLRTMVGDEYDGVWNMADPAPVEYDGEILQPEVSGYSEYTMFGFQVFPLQEMGGFIPSALNTRKLDIGWPIQEYHEQQIFFSPMLFETQYNVYYNRYGSTYESLNEADPLMDSRYLNAPPELLANLRPLALSITEGHESAYGKLKALEEYLRENYAYDVNFEQSPVDIDPVEWFLFHERKGVCSSFNSAFVLLARSIGLPARLVGGYLVNPNVESQTVTSKQRHAYAEVPFEKLGWITFDATALGNGTIPIGEPPEKAEKPEGVEEVEGELEPEEDPEKDDAVDTATETPAEGGLPPDVNLFTIYGAPGTSYLRNIVGEEYTGSWNVTDPTPGLYSGGLLRHPVTGYRSSTVNRFLVAPISEMGGFIPTPIYTTEVGLDGPIQFYRDELVFFSQDTFESHYTVSYTRYEFDEDTLRNAELYEGEEYSGGEPDLMARLRTITLDVTSGSSTPYEKLKALEDYLRENCIYDTSYTRAPTGVDPVEWFLFHERRGVCANFNSAFVLMARSIGIQARLVGGYLINPTVEVQNVSAIQRHAYAEVRFQRVGWVTFDATPPGNLSIPSPGEPSEARLATTTLITQQDSVGVRGFEFVAIGEVSDMDGEPVDGLTVLIYVKEEKNETGLLSGKGEVTDGLFNVSCSLPLDLLIGEYLVEAHTLGDSRYLESWSDPPLTVVQRTRITLEVPEKAIAGRSFLFMGNLTEWWTGDPITSEDCTLHVDEAEYDYTTNEYGVFEGSYTLQTPGTYDLTLIYPGSKYFLGSNTTEEIRIIPLKVYQEPLDTLIRLDDVTFRGSVRAEDLPGDGERVIVTIDGSTIGAVTTDAAGNYRLRYTIPADQELGDIIIGYTLESNLHSVYSLTNVVARTSMIVSSPEVANVSEPFTITVELFDDVSMPIVGENVTLTHTMRDQAETAELRLDDEGRASLTLLYDDMESSSTMFYNTSFYGSYVYLGSEAEGSLQVVVPEPEVARGLFGILSNNRTLLLLLIGGVLGVSGLGAYIVYFRREEGFKGLLEPVTASLETLGDGRTRLELTLGFPLIGPPFPAVWGVEDPFKVRAALTSADEGSLGGLKLEMVFDGGDARELVLDDEGSCEVECEFMEKGLRGISVRYPGDETRQAAKAEAKLRIVDYREEILDLYNAFSDHQRSTQEEIEEHFTPREAMHVLMKYVTEPAHRPLKELTTIFEIADYSTHPIRRREYERFYLAREEIRLDE